MSSVSPVVIPPPGTRGVRVPRLPMWLVRFFDDTSFRYFRNRPFRGGRVLSLHTIGARSGEPRRSTVAFFPDGNNTWLIVASGGGTATHPAWFFNLARHPDNVEIEIERRIYKVRAETLAPRERTEAWQRITRQMPFFKDYESKTDREIPVVRLTAL
jgi:deazaflavin-dependent oxidoreductase (nitroreductase family)